jgi:N-acetylglucosaminyl-diphospho-decaprenol L-rhamnosyltransferase
VTSIGVATVTFRGGEQLALALDALALARDGLDAGTRLDVVIVDNASRDGTADLVREHAPWAELVELPRNVGFAAGSNVGIERLRDAELIVLLNPDVAVRADFLARLSSVDWPPDVAARGPTVLDREGRLEQSARGFPRARTGLLGRSSRLARARPDSRLLRRDLLADPAAGAQPVDWVSGACLIVPAERFRSVGMLDEGYFMYWEDADWCFRARAAGFSVLYDPALVVIHRQGSSSRHRAAATTVWFHRSALRYWRLHVARSRLSTAAVAAALAIRCSLKLIALLAGRVTAGVRGERDKT